jgi:glycosyltransferase involved in cell wall biosynthesis
VPGERSVLHVLPHPGGGGETYVDALSRMDGYRFERAYLAPTASPSASVLRAAAGIWRRARSYDVLHVHGEVASAVCLPALARRPSVSTLHGLHLLRRLSGSRRTAAGMSLHLVLRAASRTICVSEAEYDDLRALVGGGTLARAVVIHNGVEPLEPPTSDERAAARAGLGIEASTIAGAWIGSLDERKDPLTPIAAVSELARSGADVALLVAGDGPLRVEVEREAPPSVQVLGFRSDVRPVLAAADFFVLSSVREGLSFAVLEAMSLGLVPVVSDAPGNPEAVGDAGIVVPFGDTAAFARAFARLVSDDEERVALGERARERVVRDFRADDMVRRTRELYDAVVTLRRSRGGA